MHDRPAEVIAAPSSSGPARRAIFRWSWRLFRREWRQQILVLALVALAVAGTTVGTALAYNAGQPRDATFGTANSSMTFSGPDNADVAAARKAFGTVERIDHQSIPVPGSPSRLDLRAQDPEGTYSRPTLRLVSGRFPNGGAEVAMTASAATTFGVRIGGHLDVNGHARRLVGIVENPLDLNDEFALVAPGQADPPAQVAILFEASDHAVNAFQPSVHATSVATRGTLDTTLAATVVLALETIGLLFVGLVAAAGFTVMAQRRLRALGMLGALGATDRHIRSAMVANGAVVGVVGSVTGAVTGLVAWVALTPKFEDLVKHRIARFHLPWWAIVVAIVLATVTSIAAAWWPARSAARASIVAALSGRPSPQKPAHRFAGAGGVFLAIGVACLAFAHQDTPKPALIIGGTIATTFGMLFLGPLFIRMLAMLGRRAPIMVRLAVRDLARYQARSAAALGAISLALGIAATVAISAAAAAVPEAATNLPANQAIAYLEPATGLGEDTNAVQVMSSADVAKLAAKVSALAASLHAHTVLPLSVAINPSSPTVSVDPAQLNASPNASGGSVSIRRVVGGSAAPGAILIQIPASLGRVTIISNGAQSGFQISDQVPLYVATPAVLHRYGIKADQIAKTTDIITSRTDLHGLVVHAPPRDDGAGVRRGPEQWHPTIQHIRFSTDASHTSDPTTLVTVHALQHFGLKAVQAAWLIETPRPLTAIQISAAQHAAAIAGFTVETHQSRPSNARLRDGATLIGLLLALGVLAMTVGLIRSETANDLRTLAATGASSMARRSLTGATAGALALLGALLGTGGAYVALVAWHRRDLHPLTRVPYLNLATILVGLPIIAISAGWLLSGREPAAVGHQPLE